MVVPALECRSPDGAQLRRHEPVLHPLNEFWNLVERISALRDLNDFGTKFPRFQPYRDRWCILVWRFFSLNKGAPYSISDRYFATCAFVDSTSFSNQGTAKFQWNCVTTKSLIVHISHQFSPTIGFHFIGAIAVFDTPLILIENVDALQKTIRTPPGEH